MNPGSELRSEVHNHPAPRRRDSALSAARIGSSLLGVHAGCFPGNGRPTHTLWTETVVLRVLQSAKLDLLDGRRRLLDEMAALQGDDVEDIAPIIGGIDARITVLDSLWDSASSNLDDTHYSLGSFLERPRQTSALEIEESRSPCQDGQTGYQIVHAIFFSFSILCTGLICRCRKP